MKRLLLTFHLVLWLVPFCFAQSGSYYHDPALDSIALGVSEVNYTLLSQTNKSNGDLLTHSNVTTDAEFYLTNMTATSYVANILVNPARTKASNYFVALTNALGSFDMSEGTNVAAVSGYHDDLPYSMDIQLSGYDLSYIPDTVTWGFGLNISQFDNLAYNYGFNILDVATLVRETILALFALVIFYWLQRNIKEEIDITTNQRQTSGAAITIAGNRGSPVIALLYSATITAAILAAANLFGVSFMGDLFGKAAVSYFNFSHLGNEYAYAAWGIITAFFPAAELLAMWISYQIQREFILWPLFYAVRALISWLPV